VSQGLSRPISLYELSLEVAMIRDLLEANEGELTPELEERLDALMQAGPERVEAAAMVVLGMEGSAAVCQQESLRLAARAAEFDRQAKQLKERMTMVLDCAFGGKLKTHKFTVWTQQAADHVAFDVAEGHSIEEVEQAAPSLVRVKKELDKIALKERFKSGEPLPTAIAFETHPGKRYTRIR
jgi:hypothetical protein